MALLLRTRPPGRSDGRFHPERIGVGVQVVSPGLIDQSGVLFAPKINLTIFPGLISQAGVLFSPSLNFTVSPGLISQAGVLFAPKVNLGISLGLIDASGVVFAPTVISAQIVTFGLISQAGVVFSPSILRPGQEQEGIWQKLNRYHVNPGHWDDVSQGRVLRWPP